MLDKKKREFGTIVFESDIDREASGIYRLYDERWLVEEFFRRYKDEDEFSKTRGQDDTSVVGSEFINFIASVMTARLFNRFDSLALFEEYSYKDIMCDLSQAVKVKTGSEGQWLFVRFPLGIQEELQKLGHDIDRKIITMRDAKKVGDYVATVHFHKEVIVEVPVKVVAEGEQNVEEAPKAEEAPVEAPKAEEAAVEE